MKLLFTLILTAALSGASCSTPPPPEGLPDFTKAEEIRIENDWTGLSPVAPIKRHYALRRAENGFAGEANFSVGGARREARTARADVAMPRAEALSFLEKLGRTDFREGDYEPKFEHTDDYPSVKIDLRIEGENVVIFSKSQGGDHAPWGMTYKGKTYVSDSGVPARALDELTPFLKPDVFKQLIKQE